MHAPWSACLAGCTWRAYGRVAAAAGVVLASFGFASAQADSVSNPGIGGTFQTSVIQPANASNPSTEETSKGKPSIQAWLGPYGDPGGLRAFLKTKGIFYDFTYAGEVFGNPTGGLKRGATYEGRLNGRLDVDLGTFAGLRGSSVHASFYDVQGRGLSGNNLRDLFVVSGIEAYPSATLYRVYFEQEMADGKLTVRAGQLAADFEFFLSETALLFLDSTFGFPAILSNDLPSGGPQFPLATPGVRFKYVASDSVTLLGALYNGDPAGPYRPGVNSILPEVRDLNGTLFRLADPPLLLTEAQFVHGGATAEAGLPGSIKIGYFHHFGVFPDYAAPVGTTATVRGDDGIYGVLDQTIYRVPGSPEQGIAVFARAAASPGDRNLIDIYADSGVAFKGLVPGRPKDAFGLALAYGRVSSSVHNQDYVTGTPLIRDFQAVAELAYQFVVMPGFSIRPDFQYVFHPGAHGVGDPGTNQPIRDAAVFGLRATVHY